MSMPCSLVDKSISPFMFIKDKRREFFCSFFSADKFLEDVMKGSPAA
jgi:hypothetical protein